MVDRSIRVRPGDLVRVDFDARPLEVVYRWWRATVAEIRDADITIATLPWDSDPWATGIASVLRGLEVALAAGDSVFLDASDHGRPVVIDVAVDGEPAHPERFADQYARNRYDVRNVPEAEGLRPVERIAEVMSSYGLAWCLCGGWAIDAWLGRQTRYHADVDIAVFEDDQRALFEHLPGWQLIAHDPNVRGDTNESWDGRRRLDLPAHIHALERPGELSESLDRAVQQGFHLDIQLNERSDGEWVLSREPRVAMSLADCIRQSAWGLPTLVPEVVLFYKAGEGPFLRGHDDLDFRMLLPQLTPGQRSWLRDAIGRVHADHPWLSRFG
jgi:hypothetical protein